MTAASRGRAWSTACRRWARSTSSARTRSSPACCSRAPSARSTRRPTTARTGCPCDRTCRRRRSATWSFTRTTSWSARTAGRSGSSTTSRRCANSPRPLERSVRTCTGRLGQRACGGTCSRIRRFHPRSLPARTRPTAPRSTTTCRGRPARSRSRSSIAAAASYAASRTDEPEDVIDPGTLPYPTYWFRPPQRIATGAGHHRIVWDLRHPPPRGAARSFSIAAVVRNTPSGPVGPYVHPGRYRVRLTGGDRQRGQPDCGKPGVTRSAFW